jgi:hypothetical protein
MHSSTLPPGPFRSLYPQHCAIALQRALTCRGNGHLSLFKISGEAEGDNFCPNLLTAGANELFIDNPFLGREEFIHRVWSGPAHVSPPGSPTLERKSEGPIEVQQRKLTIVADGIQLETGLWAIVSFLGDTIAGQLTSLSRDTPPLVKLTVDTAKPIPFDVALVGEGPWPRMIQN